jgi:hypothetical protein
MRPTAPRRPAPRSVPALLGLALALAGLHVGEAAAAPLVPRADDGATCVQVGFAGADADAADPDALQVRVGWRADGRGCASVPVHPLPAAALPAVLGALRAVHARGVPACPPGAPDGVRALELDTDGRVHLRLQACGQVAELVVDPAATAEADRLAEAGAVAWRLERRAATAGAGRVADTADDAAEPGAAGAGWRSWAPDALRLDASFTRETSDDRRKRELDLRGHAAWYRGDDEVQVEFEVEVERYDDRAPKDERNARGVWFHALTPGLFTMAEVFSERDEVRVSGLDFDYRLVQAGAGLGWRWGRSDRGWVRAAALYNRFDLHLFDVDVSLGLDAPSVYLAGEWPLSARARLSADARHYWWPSEAGGDTGLDAGAEVVYDLGRALGLGLRWDYSRNAATLSRADEESTSLFLRYRP